MGHFGEKQKFRQGVGLQRRAIQKCMGRDFGYHLGICSVELSGVVFSKCFSFPFH